MISKKIAPSAPPPDVHLNVELNVNLMLFVVKTNLGFFCFVFLYTLHTTFLIKPTILEIMYFSLNNRISKGQAGSNLVKADYLL